MAGFLDKLNKAGPMLDQFIKNRKAMNEENKPDTPPEEQKPVISIANIGKDLIKKLRERRTAGGDGNYVNEFINRKKSYYG